MMTPDEQKMLAALSHEQMLRAQQAYNMIKDYFLGSEERTFIWFHTKNEHLDNKMPKEFMINGKIDKLLSHIEKNMIH